MNLWGYTTENWDMKVIYNRDKTWKAVGDYESSGYYVYCNKNRSIDQIVAGVLKSSELAIIFLSIAFTKFWVHFSVSLIFYKQFRCLISLS